MVDYKLALGSLDELEKGAMRQAMILDDREGGHWGAEVVQDHYSNVKLALEQAEKEHKAIAIIKKYCNINEFLKPFRYMREIEPQVILGKDYIITQEEYDVLREVFGR